MIFSSKSKDNTKGNGPENDFKLSVALPAIYEKTRIDVLSVSVRYTLATVFRVCIEEESPLKETHYTNLLSEYCPTPVWFLSGHYCDVRLTDTIRFSH